MQSYSKYDGLLAGIGITIALMLTGILVAKALVIGAGVAGMVLVGMAMFVYTPREVEQPQPSPEPMMAD